VPAGPQSLLVQVRQYEAHSVQYALLHLQQQQVAWQDLSPENSWLTNIVGVWQQTALLRRYEHDQNPEQQSLLAYDLATKNLLWEAQDFTFLRVVNQSQILGFLRQQEERFYYLLDLRQGTLTEPTPQQLKQWEQPAVAPSQAPKNSDVQMGFPVAYAQGSTHFNTFATFFEQEQRPQPVKTIEYMEYKGAIVLSYYLYQQNKLDHFLWLIDQNTGKTLLHDTLAQGLDGLATDSFMTLNGHLVFVKQQKQLVHYA